MAAAPLIYDMSGKPFTKRLLTLVLLIFAASALLRYVLTGEPSPGGAPIFFSNRPHVTVTDDLFFNVNRGWRPPCPAGITGSFDHGFEYGKFNETFAKSTFPEFIKGVRFGGSWVPRACLPVHEPIAVIVPLRGRAKHLKAFLSRIHMYLRQQCIPYVIVTVTQADKEAFNRGILLNMGVLTAPPKINCFILCDVDMLPDRYENMFTCDHDRPKSLTAAASYLEYKPIFPENFGGIVAMSRQQFYTVNGYSTMYWGWGEEDNDMYNRIALYFGGLTRVPYSVGLISHLDHSRNESGPVYRDRFQKISSSNYDFMRDGVGNTLSLCDVKSIDYYPLRTDVLVFCRRPPETQIEKFIKTLLS